MTNLHRNGLLPGEGRLSVLGGLELIPVTLERLIFSLSQLASSPD